MIFKVLIYFYGVEITLHLLIDLIQYCIQSFALGLLFFLFPLLLLLVKCAQQWNRGLPSGDRGGTFNNKIQALNFYSNRWWKVSWRFSYSPLNRENRRRTRRKNFVDASIPVEEVYYKFCTHTQMLYVPSISTVFLHLLHFRFHTRYRCFAEWGGSCVPKPCASWVGRFILYALYYYDILLSTTICLWQ